MPLLKPDLLKRLVNHDRTVTRAIAMLNGHWSDVMATAGPQAQIDAPTVRIAKRLTRAGLFSDRFDFNDYARVQKYLIHHDVYLSASGRQVLLEPFRE